MSRASLRSTVCSNIPPKGAKTTILSEKPLEVSESSLNRKLIVLFEPKNMRSFVADKHENYNISRKKCSTTWKSQTTVQAHTHRKHYPQNPTPKKFLYFLATDVDRQPSFRSCLFYLNNLVWTS